MINEDVCVTVAAGLASSPPVGSAGAAETSSGCHVALDLTAELNIELAAGRQKGSVPLLRNTLCICRNDCPENGGKCRRELRI